MARRQMQIPGTQRKEVPEVEKAGEAFREVRDERRALKDREKQKKIELIAVMQAHKVKVYKWRDDETGDEIRVEISEGETKVKLAKTGEADSVIGEGLPSAPAHAGGVHPALLDQAERSMAEANVEQSEDGDVVVPETSAPKTKSKRKKKS